MREMIRLGASASSATCLLPKLPKCKTVMVMTLLWMISLAVAQAEPLPGGTLDPTSIEKYVTPLLIPPAMPKSKSDKRVDYQIAVRQLLGTDCQVDTFADEVDVPVGQHQVDSDLRVCAQKLREYGGNQQPAQRKSSGHSKQPSRRRDL